MAAFKIFALVLGLCVVCAAVVGGLLWRSHGAAAQAALEQVGTEATDFASEHPQQGCVDESFRRAASCDGIWCDLRVSIFARICLAEAEPSPGLCADVPDSTAAAVFWPALSCANSDARYEVCETVFREVVQACLARRAAG